MASLMNRKGVWYGRHVFYVNGKRKEKKVSFETGDEKVARRRLARWQNELDAAKWGEASPILLEDAARRYMSQQAALLRPNTRVRYATSMKQVVPFFAGRRLDSISKGDLLRFMHKRKRDAGRGGRGKVADASIRRDLALLSSILSFAIANEWIEHNPVPPFLRDQRKVLKRGDARTRYLSHEEESRLLVAILNGPQHNRALAQLHHDMVEFAIETGLRQAEQHNLKWEQVQFGVRPSLVISETKSGKPRKVPLTDRAQMVLHRRAQHPTSPYVFWFGRKGAKLGSMKRAFAAAVSRAGLKDVRWHDLRRTCGCRLLQDRGATMTQVRDWFDHSSVAVTEKHYAFLEEGSLHDLVSGPAPRGGVRPPIVPLSRLNADAVAIPFRKVKTA